MLLPPMPLLLMQMLRMLTMPDKQTCTGKLAQTDTN